MTLIGFKKVPLVNIVMITKKNAHARGQIEEMVSLLNIQGYVGEKRAYFS